jgi:hypothetical protein
VFPDFVDRANVGMVQSGRSVCLAVEAAQSLQVWSEAIGQKLKGDGPSELHILGFVNNAHTTAAKFLDNAVMRDRATD